MERSRDRAPEGLLELQPIGVIRSSYAEKRDAPRQGVARGGDARLELAAGRGLEHAVEGLEGFTRVWLVSWLDRARSAGRAGPSKVLPPRSSVRRGVLATRSPHRPNPIGLTAARLVRVSGLVLELAEVDLLDGTPVLDVKPYLPYADAFPGERSGWLERPSDPVPALPVEIEPRAQAALDLLARFGAPLEAALRDVLSVGADPKPYRRIRLRGATRELALKAWRVDFVLDAGADGPRVRVLGIRTGYRAAELAARAGDPELAAHAALAASFGPGAAR